jgi:diguanylate cyclase (GGDEF)-like protein
MNADDRLIPSEASGSVDALRSLQNQVLESVATGQPLASVIDLMCREAERLAPDVICTVLAVDPTGHVRSLGSPSLPDHFARAIDGMPIGPNAGSCGTAAFRGEPVEVRDIAGDPLWAAYRSLALPLGLAACWSSPIKAHDGRVIGTFAFYYRTTRGPSELDRLIVATCVHLCAIAIEHEEAQARIHELAFRDPLTGLPNRASFQQCATEALAACTDEGDGLAIHYMDLDDFKGVNDTLGHWIGDHLLEQVARRIMSCVKGDELVTRLGGDEFAIVQTRPNDLDDVLGLAKQLIGLFDEPFDVEGHEILIGASIGIVRAPDHGADLTSLLKKADLALYRAKNEGRRTYRVFAEEMYERVQVRKGLEHDLRLAIGRGEFELVYQPIVEIDTHAIVSAEALVRWRHPTRGTISPSEFIPIAEETGLIVKLGDWILREACTNALEWPAPVRVAVNLSPVQLRKTSFVLDVVRALDATGLPPSRLDFEITETVPLVANAVTRQMLYQLKAFGIRIALDDFGTGYSSLSYLRSFPFDRIKIDRAFVHELEQRPDTTSIVRAVISLARDLGIRTTAEGVETARQLAWLKQEGCSEGQGYYYRRPLSLKEFRGLFDRPALVPLHHELPMSAESVRPAPHPMRDLRRQVRNR